MKKFFLINFCLLSIFGTCFSFEAKDPYENFRISILEQIISVQFIVIDKKKPLALDLMRKMKVGENFLKEIECKEAAKMDRGTLDECLNNVFFTRPEKFKAFYRSDLDITIKALKKEGFIILL